MELHFILPHHPLRTVNYPPIELNILFVNPHTMVQQTLITSTTTLISLWPCKKAEIQTHIKWTRNILYRPQTPLGQPRYLDNPSYSPSDLGQTTWPRPMLYGLRQP
jgi:hypothetical protein